MIDLVAIARSLFAPGKGILAADESTHTAVKRLASYGIATSEEMRRQYRDLFFGAPDIEKYLSGVILFSETLTQKGDDKKMFPASLRSHGIEPGIKVDEGTEPLPASPNELITKGLLDLPERLTKYKKSNVSFTKWRAVLRIDGESIPSAVALTENCKRLAGYAKAVQTVGLVPILEPEVLLEGTHSRKRSKAVIEKTFQVLFSELAEQAVDRASIVIKTAMALSGDKSGKSDSPEEVAEDTLAALTASVPRQVAGIVFLSGGQTPDQATENLRAICRAARAQGAAPWPLTFSYARALQEEALAIWKGRRENVLEARAAFLARLSKVSAAVQG